MKTILRIITVVIVMAMGINTQAQRWPVGIASVQDSVKSMQFDTIHHKIGLVNVDPNTTIDFMAYGGNVNKINVAARFRGRNTYRIIGFGTHYMGLDKKFSGALFYRLGQYIQPGRRWSLGGDIGFSHIETFEHNSADKPERLFSLEARLNVDYQFHRNWGAFATVGYGDARYYKGGSRYRNNVIVEAGVTLRHRQRMNAAPRHRHEEDTVYSDQLSLNQASNHINAHGTVNDVFSKYRLHTRRNTTTVNQNKWLARAFFGVRI